jgi:hypothetical protein
VLTGPGGSIRFPNVLAEVGHNASSTLFKAVHLGWTTIAVDEPRACGVECNVPVPLLFDVVVVSAAEMQNGILISDRDAPWDSLSNGSRIVHVHHGQRFSIAFHNRSSLRPFTRVVDTNPAVIVPQGVTLPLSDGIRESFQAVTTGDSQIFAAGDDCSPACVAPHPNFSLEVAS